MTGPGIVVDNLSLQLGATQVLSNLSFSIEPGSIHCLIGPNGGGKTSTLRCLLGEMPHRGTIRIDWYTDNHCIGYVPQGLNLANNLPLTVTDFLTLISQRKAAFIGIHRQARARIESALERVGLKEKRHHPLGSLSGGERQRLLFAQALMPQPSLLLLDEPMTSLDETGTRVFSRLIRQLHDEGITVVWVNHDLQQVHEVADGITVIDGHMLAHGPTEETLTPAMQQGNFRSPQKEGS